jgi:AraC family transcriptional regulator of adaptative response / DNA-3-methyladenine glycosylase II
VRAALGEQQDIGTAQRRIARLVARVGRPIATGCRGLTHLFPTAAALAAANLHGLGLSTSRADLLRRLARLVQEGALDLGGPVEAVDAALRSLCGFDASMAQYVALRALGEPDAFPSGDPLLRRIAGADGTPLSRRALEERAEAWRPWRGYAALHLWCAAEHPTRTR